MPSEVRNLKVFLQRSEEITYFKGVRGRQIKRVLSIIRK